MSKGMVREQRATMTQTSSFPSVCQLSVLVTDLRYDIHCAKCGFYMRYIYEITSRVGAARILQ